MKWQAFALVPLACIAAHASEGRVRHVPVIGDQIVTVHTAIGIATIIQVPDAPGSVVVGDQEGFRVEYLDRAITIKPLRAGARSNLYVYTDSRRYNVQLATGGETVADYVVYLESSKPVARVVGRPTSWTRLEKYVSFGKFRLQTHRLGKTSSGVLLVEFEVTSTKAATFDPAWVWVTQSQEARPIQSLFLSKVQVSPGSPIEGALQLLRSDIDPAAPIRIELRNKRMAFLTLPRVTLWK